MSEAATTEAATVTDTTSQTQAATETQDTQTTTEATSGDKSLLNQEGDKAVSQGAPEKYETWKLPEGYELDTGVSDEASGIFRELGLSQEAGQKLVDFYTKHSLATNEGLSDLVRQQNETWQNEAKNHPDLKGKLGPGGPVLTTISRALDVLGDAQLKADFRQAMDFTGAGNHPAFIRMFYALASRLVEGTHVAGNGPSPHGQQQPGAKPPSAAAAMYPSLAKG